MPPGADTSTPEEAASSASGAGGRGRSGGGVAWNAPPSRTSLQSRPSSEDSELSECSAALRSRGGSRGEL